MKKIKLLFLIVCTALAASVISVNAQNQTCATALPISNGSSQSLVSSDINNWAHFTATQFTHKIIVWMDQDTIIPDLDSVFLYSGSCTGLVLMQSMAAQSNQNAVFTAAPLAMGATFYILAKRLAGSGTLSSAKISFYVETTASACSDMIFNGSFEQHTGLPYCLSGPPYSTNDFATYTVGIADGWTTQYSSINHYTYDNGNSQYMPSTSDYFNTASGNIGCLNFNPTPRSFQANAGMCFTSDLTNGLGYKEYIISDYGTTSPVIQGRSYKLSYFYKRADGNVHCTFGIYSTSALTQDVVASGLQISGIESPDANGWTRVDCYFTAQWTGNFLFGIMFTSAGLAPSQSNYFMIDDVSMYESIAINQYTLTPTVCANSGIFTPIQASGATSYTWTISPFTNLNQTGSSCTIPNFPGPGTYTLTVTGTTAGGCTTSASTIITVLPVPTATVTPVGPITVCADQLPVILTETNSAGSTVSWFETSSPTSQGTSIPGTNTAQANSTGYYFVQVVNPVTGCVGQSNLVHVIVNPSPILAVTSMNENCASANDGSGSVTVTSGTSPFTYNWNTNPVQTTSIANGLDAGTYTVTVTDANSCSSTATVTVSTAPPLPVPVITNDAFNNNLCNSTTVTYTIANYGAYPAGTIFNVTTVPALILQNPVSGIYIATWPSCNSDVTFTVSAYVGNQICAVSATSTVFACCGCVSNPADVIQNGTTVHDDLLDFLNDYNPGNLTTGIIYHVSSNWFYNNPNGIFYIDGTFNVNSAIASSLTFMPGSQVRFGANAKILLTGAGVTTVNINQSHFAAGCNDMWDGIYATGTNKTINVSGNATQVSLIEDAENGLVLSAGANFTTTNAVFNKNYISIQVKNYANNHPGSVSNSVFTCRNLNFTGLTMIGMRGFSSSSVSCQQPSLPVANNAVVTLLSPYLGKRSYAGVFLDNIGASVVNQNTHQITTWTNITIGSGNLNNFNQLNIFDNLDYGIYAQNSNVIARNNQFQNLTGPTVINKNTINFGVGIYGTNNALNNPMKIIVGPNNARNSFYDCNRGVDLNDYYESTVTGNCFQSNIVYSLGSPNQSPVGNYAVIEKSGKYIDVEIGDNHIFNWNTGISFTSEYIPFLNQFIRMQGSALIHNNQISPVATGPITTQYIGTAIFAQSLTLNCTNCSSQNFLGNLQIRDNNLITDVFNGIYLEGWEHSPRVRDNVITMKYQPNFITTVIPQSGIRSINNQEVVIYSNHIFGNTTTGNTAGKIKLRGIYLTSNIGPYVRCNDMTDVGQCLVFEGDNIGTVWDNIMNNSTDGFVLMNQGRIGPQGTFPSNTLPNGVASDNHWVGPFANSQTLTDASSASSFSTLFVRPGAVNTLPTTQPFVNLGPVATHYFYSGNLGSIVIIPGGPPHLCNLPQNLNTVDNGNASDMRTMQQENTIVPEQSIELFPNPNDGNAILSYTLADDQEGQLQIYNLEGQLVAKISLIPGVQKQAIDLDELSSGMYFYRVVFGNALIKSDKLIITR